MDRIHTIKKYIPFIIGLLLASGVSVLAAPSSNIFRFVYPETNNTYDLGSSTTTWRNIYVQTASTSAITVSGLGNTSTNCLQVNNQGVISVTGSACAGSSSVGGSSGQFQYNNSGSLGGSSNLTIIGSNLFATTSQATSTWLFATTASTTNATSSTFYTGIFGLNNSYFTSLTGTGLQNSGGSLGLNLGNANIWTAKQTFNAQTDMLGPLVIGTSTASTTIWGAAATSTFASGINLNNGGCFSINGSCLSTLDSQQADFKQAVSWASTTTLPANNYANGSSGVGATISEIGAGALYIDGNNPAIGDRVLIKNESTPSHNGIYDVTVAGSGIASFVLTRSTDYNQAVDIYAGTAVYVVGGTANTDTTWVMTSAAPITVGTTALNFSELSVGTLTAGTGISVSGSTITNTGVISNSCSSGVTCSGTNPSLISLDLTSANTWTGLQSFSAGLLSNASSTLVNLTMINSTTTNATTTFLSIGNTASTSKLIVGGAATFNNNVTIGQSTAQTLTVNASSTLTNFGATGNVYLGDASNDQLTVTATSTFVNGVTAQNGVSVTSGGLTVANKFSLSTSTPSSVHTMSVNGPAIITGSSTFGGVIATGTAQGGLQSLIDTSGTITIDATQGNTAIVTLTSTGRTVVFSKPQPNMVMRFFVCEDSTGSRTITSWPSNFRWSGGSAPTLTTAANKCDIISLITASSTASIFAAPSLNY